MKKALTALVALGLVLAITGGAFAAKGLLTGADIKKGSLTGANIASHSVGAGVFTASARKSLAGLRGQAGSPGSAGSVGATGAAGPDGAKGSAGTNGSNGINGTNGTNGTVSPLATAAGTVAISTPATLVPVVTMNVPAGKYTVLAKTQISQTGAGDSVNCILESGVTTIDSSAMKTGPALFATTVPLQAVVTTTGPSTTLTVGCSVQTATGSATNSSIIAIPSS